MFFAKQYKPLNEYRIAESVIGFQVEQKAYCVQDKKEDWHRVGGCGGIRPRGAVGSMPFAVFNTIKEARAFVRQIKHGTVYHKC